MATSKYPVGSTDSILEYASNSQQRTPAPEPPPPTPTAIGVLTLAGPSNVNAGKLAAYAISNNGDASGLTYLWTIEGGTGSPSNEICDVTWGEAGSGKVTCKVTSSDPNVSDSPKSKSINTTIAAEELDSFLSTEGGEKITDEDGNPIAPE